MRWKRRNRWNTPNRRQRDLIEEDISMPDYDPNMTPQLRPVEVHPVEMDGHTDFIIQDPARLATSAITVSEPVLFILSHFDGLHTLDDIRQVFLQQFRQPVEPDTLTQLVNGLRDAHLLADEEFERFHESLVESVYAEATRIADRVVSRDDEKSRFDWERSLDGLLTKDRKSTRLNSSHTDISRMPSSA